MKFIDIAILSLLPHYPLFPEGGRGAKGKGVAPTYYLAKFSRKLHENDENWTETQTILSNAMYAEACQRGRKSK